LVFLVESAEDIMHGVCHRPALKRGSASISAYHQVVVVVGITSGGDGGGGPAAHTRTHPEAAYEAYIFRISGVKILNPECLLLCTAAAAAVALQVVIPEDRHLLHITD
jgi:hypothetical protein